MKMKLMLLAALIAALTGGCKSKTGVVEPGSKTKAPVNDTITYFSLTRGGGMARFSGFRYQVRETKEGRVHFLFNEGYPDEKEFTVDDHSVFDTLQNIVLKYKMYNYSGYYTPEFDILDGESWGLDVDYISGKRIDAGGYMAGPDNYWEAFREIRQYLDQWKALPVATNDVVYFLYEYGPDRYTLERKDDHAVMTIDNELSGKHEVLERELDVLEDLRVLFNVTQLKMDRIRTGELDPDATPWMYEITYSNGDHYHYESYDRSYQCGYTESLQSFISNCLKEKEERNHFYYY